METQRGALLATEVRNNASKLKKFVACALMAGCDDLKLGFVSRKTNSDNGECAGCPGEGEVGSSISFTSGNNG